MNTGDGNLATLQSAVQSSTYISSAGAAVDNNPTTASCTDDDQGQPWWALDLAAAYTIHRVVVVMPDFNGDNCNYYCTSLHLRSMWQTCHSCDGHKIEHDDITGLPKEKADP